MRDITLFGTVGPACGDAETLRALVREGMRAVRLNLSHAGIERCGPWLSAIARVREETGYPALLVDIEGGELRVGALAEPLTLRPGARVRLSAPECARVGEIPAPRELIRALLPGMRVRMDDGTLLLRAISGDSEGALLEVELGGVLHGRKSISAPEARFDLPAVTREDREQLRLAAQHGASMVMLPFVRRASDVLTLREALSRCGMPDAHIYAKLESPEGLDALGEWLPHCDHLVIARGDLGANMPLHELPVAQKRAARACRDIGKPFMVVTQLLHSMMRAPTPTRAEVSDIANAVWDGAGSLMLTGETAVGEYPVPAMRALRQTAEAALRYEETQ